jgi:hypothetical protein
VKIDVPVTISWTIRDYKTDVEFDIEKLMEYYLLLGIETGSSMDFEEFEDYAMVVVLDEFFEKIDFDDYMDVVEVEPRDLQPRDRLGLTSDQFYEIRSKVLERLNRPIECKGQIDIFGGEVQ